MGSEKQVGVPYTQEQMRRDRQEREMAEEIATLKAQLAEARNEVMVAKALLANRHTQSACLACASSWLGAGNCPACGSEDTDDADAAVLRLHDQCVNARAALAAVEQRCMDLSMDVVRVLDRLAAERAHVEAEVVAWLRLHADGYTDAPASPVDVLRDYANHIERGEHRTKEKP